MHWPPDYEFLDSETSWKDSAREERPLPVVIPFPLMILISRPPTPQHGDLASPLFLHPRLRGPKEKKRKKKDASVTDIRTNTFHHVREISPYQYQNLHPPSPLRHKPPRNSAAQRYDVYHAIDTKLFLLFSKNENKTGSPHIRTDLSPTPKTSHLAKPFHPSALSHHTPLP